jgi:hypothetical protein
MLMLTGRAAWSHPSDLGFEGSPGWVTGRA